MSETATTRLSDTERRLVETNGIEIIDEAERTARPADLFWPWFAANVSVFGISWGSFVLGFGISFWQALAVTVLGVVLSFFFCGVIAIAGKRGSAPTMVLSRAAFGVNGQKVPGIFSWLISMGWETFLAIMAVLATATVFEQLGWAHGTTEQIPLPSGALGSRSLQLTGLDVSYRAYGKEARRLLLRAEHLWHRYRSDLGREMTTGYYALANYRWNKYNDFGVLYDWTEIPGLHGHHESALSAIFTRQFTEQTYARLQLTRGDRPGMRNYTEAWLQMVWGIGPHTHQLE